MKLCPLLESKGVYANDPGYGLKKNWIKELCGECPLWDEETQTGYCVYDKSGPISKEDEKALLKKANKIKEINND